MAKQEELIHSCLVAYRTDLSVLALRKAAPGAVNLSTLKTNELGISSRFDFQGGDKGKPPFLWTLTSSPAETTAVAWMSNSKRAASSCRIPELTSSFLWEGWDQQVGLGRPILTIQFESLEDTKGLYLCCHVRESREENKRIHSHRQALNKEHFRIMYRLFYHQPCLNSKLSLFSLYHPMLPSNS